MYNKAENPKNNTINEKSSDKSSVCKTTDSSTADTMHADTITIYDKIDKVIEKIFYWKYILWYSIVFFMIFLTISCIKITRDNTWEKLLTYPEETYKDLEEEANKIAETDIFESKYKLGDIQYYDDSKTLSFKLYDESSSANLIVNIYNYKLENQYLDTIRNETNELKYKFLNILALIILCALLPAMVIIFLIMILVLLISFITFCIQQRNTKKNSHKND